MVKFHIRAVQLDGSSLEEVEQSSPRHDLMAQIYDIQKTCTVHTLYIS